MPGDRRLAGPATGIERAFYPAPALVHDVRVDYGGGNVRVPEQFLHRSAVVAGFRQMGCERMAKRMAAYRLAHVGKTRRFLNGPLQDTLANLPRRCYP